MITGKRQRMMGKTIRLLTAALTVVLAASCSQGDDFLPDGVDATSGDVQEYTFTVGIDSSMEGDTRAISTTEDDAPTRCRMQVFDGNTAVDAVQSGTADGNNYTFTVMLAAGNTYTFCFWADNGTQEITSLTNVPYTPGNIAFAYTTEGTPETVSSNGIELKHAVAKVSLVTTAATTIAEGEPFTASTQCAETYNVLTGTASGTQDYATPETSDSFSANAGVTSFYVLPAAETQSITLNAHLLTQTIADVPLAANTHVTLRGDLSDNNGNWAGTPEYYKEVFYNALFDDDGAPKVEKDDFGNYNYYAPDDTVQRILTEVLKTSIRDGETKIITTPWGDSMTLGYVPVYLAITYNGYEMYLYNGNLPGANLYYQITLPDVIH